MKDMEYKIPLKDIKSIVIISSSNKLYFSKKLGRSLGFFFLNNVTMQITTFYNFFCKGYKDETALRASPCAGVKFWKPIYDSLLQNVDCGCKVRVVVVLKNKMYMCYCPSICACISKNTVTTNIND